MIENFETIQEQLKKLAPTINAFKSEAVQLRIVELIFSGAEVAGSTPDEDQGSASGKIQKKKKLFDRSKKNSKTKVTSGKAKAEKAPRKTSRRPGPGAMVDSLIAEGFFKTGRGPADVVQHCRDNKVQIYTNTEASVALSRAVKSQKLKREKNKDGQFKYIKA